MARITRKELKTDKFALEVEHTVDFFDEHKQEILRYGAAALVVVLILVAIYFYRNHQHAVREQALSQALQVLEAPTGPNAGAGGLSFPTTEARNQEAAKRFGELAAKYPGTTEGAMAEFTLASLDVDAGRLSDAEKRYNGVADHGDKKYASLAKLSLAQIYFSTGRVVQGEEILRPLIDKPTVFVSKEEATIALARGIARTKPADARKLLDPLRASRSSAVSQAAIQLYSEIQQ